ncbi:FLUCTUATING-LIGHT-ACCLIMATION protein 1, chloroplastic-like [Henckelia pumila]|uniref:FLUCTUATING-LIGHT-ACCLIMATION protein 1, chloroplastic-like n=1 Tax=Henckelia pumila TaxID=405737 RepID=UPI003C6DD110
MGFVKLRAKCFFISNIHGSGTVAASITKAPRNSKTRENPIEFVVQTKIEKFAAAGVLVAMLLMYDPGSAMAARFVRPVCVVRHAVGSGSGARVIFVVLMVVWFLVQAALIYSSHEDAKISVLKLQVGLLGLGRSVQKDLNHIAEIADTSTSQGRHFVLSETSLSILRHSDYYCISAYSSVEKRSINEVEERFNQLSMEERRKFDEETLVNVNNIKKQRSTIPSSSGFRSEYVVITMVVTAEGEHNLSCINNSKDLEEALQKLGSFPSSTMLAVEVLWTPQKEDDTLSERELLEDYPLLRPLKEV